MVNINLKTGETQSSEKIKLGKVLPLMIIIFVAVLLIYGGIVAFSYRTDGDIADLNVIYTGKLNELRSGNARSVLDFQNRLNQSDKIIDESLNSRDSLQEVERLMVPNVVLDAYDFDASSKKVLLSCISNNYDDIAKQIFTFKKSDYFSNVLAGETVFVGNEGGIKFDVTLSLK